jgi:O-antigen/teichoic acid export membrane protein
VSTDSVRSSLEALAAHDRQGLKRRLILGYSAQGLFLAVRTLEQIVLVPFFIAAWGTDLYRDWLVLFAAAGFVPLIDLGMTYHFQNALRAAWARADRAAFERLLQIRLGIYLGLLAIIGPLVVGAGLCLLAHGVIGLHAMSPRSAGAVFALLALHNLLTLVQHYLSGIHVARNDFDRAVLFLAVALIVQIGAVAGALGAGAAPPAVAALFLAMLLIFGCAPFALDQLRRYPDLSYRIALPSRQELRQVAAKSLLFWVPYAGLTMQIHAPVLLLGQLATLPSAVVAFTVARTLTGLVRQLGQQLAHASGIEMARQAAQKDLGALRSLAMTTGRLISGLVGLLAGGLWVAAEPAIRLWTHGQVPYDPWLIGMLLATVMVITPAQVGYVALHYTNQPLRLAIAFVVQATGGLLLSAALIPGFGALGVALGMGAAEMLAIGGFVSIAGLGVETVPVAAFLRSTYGSALAAFALGAAVAAPLRYLLSPDGLSVLLLFGLAWLGIAGLPAVYLLLRPDQRSWLASTARIRRYHP